MNKNYRLVLDNKRPFAIEGKERNYILFFAVNNPPASGSLKKWENEILEQTRLGIFLVDKLNQRNGNEHVSIDTPIIDIKFSKRG